METVSQAYSFLYLKGSQLDLVDKIQRPILEILVIKLATLLKNNAVQGH